MKRVALVIAVDNIDEVIRIIRASATPDAAKTGLQERFALSTRQSQAIVDMRLARLTGLEREKLEEEFNALVAEIGDLKDILARDERVVAIIKSDLDDLEQKYGDKRRTEISREEIDGSFDIEELITEEMMVVTFSRDGYVKRTPLDVYRTQGRGGRGIIGSETKEGDVVQSLFVAGTHDHVLCFSNRGQVYWLKVYNLPEANRTSAGRAMSNLIELQPGERITNVLRVVEFDKERSIFFATQRGTVKKTSLEAYSRPKKGGIRAILLEEGDEVVAVGLCKPGDTVVISSADGQAIRFADEDVRSMGRTSYGVRGIRLLGEDKVVDMKVAVPDTFVLSACENGFGKRTALEEYPIKGRGGQGVINIRTEGRNGQVIGTVMCREDDEVMFITQSGMIVRSPVNEMRPMGRNTQGVRLVNLKDGDKLVGIELVSAEDLTQYQATQQRRIVPATAAEAEADEPEEPLPDGPEADGPEPDEAAE